MIRESVFIQLFGYFFKHDNCAQADMSFLLYVQPLQWRHNERDGVSNHQPHDCLLNRVFKAQVKENTKAPRHWPLWGEFTGDRGIPRSKGQ